MKCIPTKTIDILTAQNLRLNASFKPITIVDEELINKREVLILEDRQID